MTGKNDVYYGFKETLKFLINYEAIGAYIAITLFIAGIVLAIFGLIFLMGFL